MVNRTKDMIQFPSPSRSLTTTAHFNTLIFVHLGNPLAAKMVDFFLHFSVTSIKWGDVMGQRHILCKFNHHTWTLVIHTSMYQVSKNSWTLESSSCEGEWRFFSTETFWSLEFVDVTLNWGVSKRTIDPFPRRFLTHIILQKHIEVWEFHSIWEETGGIKRQTTSSIPQNMRVFL